MNDLRTRFVVVPPLFGGLDTLRLARWHGRQCVYLADRDATTWTFGVIGTDVPHDAFTVMVLSHGAN